MKHPQAFISQRKSLNEFALQDFKHNKQTNSLDFSNQLQASFENQNNFGCRENANDIYNLIDEYQTEDFSEQNRQLCAINLSLNANQKEFNNYFSKCKTLLNNEYVQREGFKERRSATGPDSLIQKRMEKAQRKENVVEFGPRREGELQGDSDRRIERHYSSTRSMQANSKNGAKGKSIMQFVNKLKKSTPFSQSKKRFHLKQKIMTGGNQDKLHQKKQQKSTFFMSQKEPNINQKPNTELFLKYKFFNLCFRILERLFVCKADRFKFFFWASLLRIRIQGKPFLNKSLEINKIKFIDKLNKKSSPKKTSAPASKELETKKIENIFYSKNLDDSKKKKQTTYNFFFENVYNLKPDNKKVLSNQYTEMDDIFKTSSNLQNVNFYFESNIKSNNSNFTDTGKGDKFLNSEMNESSQKKTSIIQNFVNLIEKNENKMGTPFSREHLDDFRNFSSLDNENQFLFETFCEDQNKNNQRPKIKKKLKSKSKDKGKKLKAPINVKTIKKKFKIKSKSRSKKGLNLSAKNWIKKVKKVPMFDQKYKKGRKNKNPNARAKQTLKYIRHSLKSKKGTLTTFARSNTGKSQKSKSKQSQPNLLKNKKKDLKNTEIYDLEKPKAPKKKLKLNKKMISEMSTRNSVIFKDFYLQKTFDSRPSTNKIKHSLRNSNLFFSTNF